MRGRDANIAMRIVHLLEIGGNHAPLDPR